VAVGAGVTCALAVIPQNDIVNSMKKYFINIDFKILWQMNWMLIALRFYPFKIKIDTHANSKNITSGRFDDDSGNSRQLCRQ
jgi:hypothetical protein